MKKSLYTLFILLGILYNSYSMGFSKPHTQAKKIITSIQMPANFQADFTYTYIPANIKKEATQEGYQVEGKLWVKGKKYRLVVEDQMVISNGKTVWNYVPSLKEVQIYNEQAPNDNKDATSLSPIQLLHLYEQDFVPLDCKQTTIDKKQYDQVELCTKEKESNMQQLILVIDRTTHQIKRMQVLEKDSSLHNFSLINLVVQSKLKDSYFEFQVPTEGIEVVDLR